MNTRFSTSACDHPQPPRGRSQPAPDPVIPGLLPSAGCEALAADVRDETLPADRPALDLDEIFVPAHYEPNYAYPLIAWLSPPAGSNGRLKRLMRTVSERNYFGVSVPVNDPDQIEQHLYETFVRLRRRYHLHTERVYLLGFGEEGTQALQTGLERPDWFAGVAAISARWPDTPRLLARYDELRGKRALIGFGERDSAAVVADALYMQQLLWSAGMHVSAVAAPTGREINHGLLREIDRWIMQGIEQPQLVC
jgi:phospholipase/carboxylesterase